MPQTQNNLYNFRISVGKLRRQFWIYLEACFMKGVLVLEEEIGRRAFCTSSFLPVFFFSGIIIIESPKNVLK
jgi:hypothetical protein